MAGRAATSNEQTKMRRDGQWAKLYLAFLPYTTVYSAQVNQTFPTTDQVVQVAYDNGSGTLASVKVGMTLWVGTTPGGMDKGFCRIRAAPDATNFYVSEESKIAWADNLYLTVVADFLLLPKHIYVDANGAVFMDRTVAYTDQHVSCNPVPMLGSFVYVLKLRPATASITLDGSGSYVIGSSISSYAWSCPTASGSSGTATATPTFTFNSVGWHLVEGTVTAANGKSKTGYRWVYVYSDAAPPVTAFVLEDCSGDADSGAVSFTVRMLAEADLTQLRDRGLAVLFTEDYYGAEAVSLGPVAGAENVKAYGWLAPETNIVAPIGKVGESSFTFEGPQQWLARMPGFPTGLVDTTGTPADWTEFQSLTVRKGAWHFLEWRTTATTILDIQLTNDARGLPSFEGARSKLWDQLLQNCAQTILAFPRCDRYGKLYVEIDPQYVFEADRASIPVVMDLTREDWSGQIQGERNPITRAGQVNFSGISYTNGEAESLFSLSPGHVPNTYGDWQLNDRYLAHASQADTNTLCGLIAGRVNNEFPSLQITLAANNPFFDIAPAMYLRLTVAAGDTQRGFAFTNKRFIPRRWRMVHNPQTLALTWELEVEAETVADLAITGDTPSAPPELPLAPIQPVPPIIGSPGLVADATELWVLVGNASSIPQFLAYAGNYFQGGQPGWNKIAIPTGLGSLGSIPHTFDMAFDGSVAYLQSYHTVDATQRIWKTANPRAASPSWTPILDFNTQVGGSAIDQIGRMFTFGLRLVCLIRTAVNNKYLAEYNGASWTFSQTSGPNASALNMTPFHKAYGILSANIMTVRASPGNSIINSEDSLLEVDAGWKNLLNGPRFMFVRTTGPVNKVWNVTADSIPLTGFNLPNVMTGSTAVPRLRGAHRGAHVCFIDDDSAGNGQIRKSVDGATWTSGATWKPGLVEHAKLAGGNTMVWVPYSVPNSNVITRLSTDAFATAGTDMTGDWWTKIQTAGETFFMLNMRCIFLRKTASA